MKSFPIIVIAACLLLSGCGGPAEDATLPAPDPKVRAEFYAKLDRLTSRLVEVTDVMAKAAGAPTVADFEKYYLEETMPVVKEMRKNSPGLCGQSEAFQRFSEHMKTCEKLRAFLKKGELGQRDAYEEFINEVTVLSKTSKSTREQMKKEQP